MPYPSSSGQVHSSKQGDRESAGERSERIQLGTATARDRFAQYQLSYLPLGLAGYAAFALWFAAPAPFWSRLRANPLRDCR